MRPIKLEMQGFQGFKNATEVDFTRLYEDSIFLITGPTGAGKTSIFDAVCYALYGEGSGKDRKDAGVYRSHLLEDDEKMEVSLSFSVREEVYHVRREENSKKGKKVAFYAEGSPEKVWTKINDVRQEVETLIGLNHDQFKKIVMIPQGEFREFLAASTKDKSEIMKKLFSTEIYNEVQSILKEMHDSAKEQNIDQMRRFAEILEESGLPGHDIGMGVEALEKKLLEQQTVLQGTKEQLKESEAKEARQREALMQAKKQNEEREEYQTIKKAFLAMEDHKVSMAKEEGELELLKRVRMVLPQEVALHEAENDLVHLKEQREKLSLEERKAREALREKNQGFEGLDKQMEFMDEKRRRQDHLNEMVQKAKHFQELKEEIQKQKRIEGELRSEVEALKRNRDKLDAGKEKEAAQMLRLATMEREALELEHRLEERKRGRKVLEELVKEHSQLEEKEKALKDLQRELARIQKNRDQQEHALAHELEKQRKNMAGLLRRELKEGMPCPVCGAIDHPGSSDAQLDFDENMLHKLESNVKQLNNQWVMRDTDYRHGVENFAELKERIEEKKSVAGVEAQDREAVHRLYAPAKEAILQMEREQKRNQEYMEDQRIQLETMQADLHRLKKDQEAKEGIFERLEEVQTALHQQMTEQRLLKERGVSSDASLHLQELQHLEQGMEEIIANHREARKDLERTREHRAGLVAKQEAMEEQILVRQGNLELKQKAFMDALETEALTEERYQGKKKLVEEIGERETRLSAFKEKYQQQKGAYESRKARGETLHAFPIEPLEEALLEGRKALDALLAAKEDQSFKVRNLVQALTKANMVLANYEKNKKRYEELQDLYNTAYLGMNFETFVQSYYFEGILLRANERLYKMTEGRYQLRRRNESESRREKVGLGLNVFDEYSGKERDVLSLSGGESFKASLALALGLSEFIEATRGAVNLETIFIDEGFGSLDQDSLDNAMEALMELNYQGRFVGIISHVSELKERILRKIEVTSLPGSGSSVRIQ